MNNFFKSEEDYKKMSKDGKIGLVATIDDEGEPHISFLTSIQPLGDDMMTVGQFCEGLSKRFFTERTKIGYLIFSADMEIWSGRAEYIKTETTGAEFEVYNNKPLFRYNSYFGIGKVHYFKIKDLSDKRNLKMQSLIPGSFFTKTATAFVGKSGKNAMNSHAKGLFSEIAGLKFISYIDSEGYPVIVPIVQATSAGSDRIIFSSFPFKKEIMKIPENIKAAVLCVNLKMESVLVKGKYNGGGIIKKLDIERVYNSMPPFPGYIFPQTEIEKITEF